MKINRLETHDRLLHLMKDQSDVVQKGAEDCLKVNPLSLAYQQRSPYVYVYGHARTHDNGVDKRLLWEPRLTKPLPAPNSYLFRAKSHTDILEMCWILPPYETWSQYKEGNVVESTYVSWSINQFRNHREELSKPFPDDLPDEQCKQILLDIARAMEENIRMRKLYAKQQTEEQFLTLSE